MVKDKNKDIEAYSGANGIEYNYLNLPKKITVKNSSTDKGTIEYVYDAAGNKLKKVTKEPGKGVTVTLYLFGNYVNDTLQYLPQEEGRIRYIHKPGDPELEIPDSSYFAYDYFIKDHLGNVRMVLTEEQKVDMYPAATMEDGSFDQEVQIYARLEETRAELPEGYPTDDYTDPNERVARVIAEEDRIGPAITLKVMAGDKINIRASSWFLLNSQTPSQSLNNILNDLIDVFAGQAGSLGTKATASQLDAGSGILDNSVEGFMTEVLENTVSSSRPNASVNWILFDEQFNIVNSSSGYDAVGSEDEFKVHLLQNITMEKNGFLFVFVSNADANIPVYFDNLQVTHTRSPILEETHYYPFGLTMAGISSKAVEFGKPGNKIKYNGQELEKGFEINWYQFKWRNHDPQIGRFFCIDPLSSKYEYLTTYQFASNNPISMREIEGLEGIKFQELDQRGNLVRHVVKQTVYVVIVEKWDKKGSGKRKPENRVESNYKKGDGSKVKEVLNNAFNGKDGIGSKNTKGETVFFDFNVKEMIVGSQNGLTDADLRQKGFELGTESEEVISVDPSNGNITNKKSPANMILGGGDREDQGGENNGVQTRMNNGRKFSKTAHLHEMLHQLITRTNEHELEGGLTNPGGGKLTPTNVDAVLEDAYKGKDKIQKEN